MEPRYNIEQLQVQLGELLTPAQFQLSAFADLMGRCGEAAQLFLCRQLLATEPEVSMPALRLLLGHEAAGLRHEAKQIVGQLGAELREALAAEMLRVDTGQARLSVLELVRDHRLVVCLPRLIELWLRMDASERCLAVDAMSTFDARPAEEALERELYREPSPQVIARVLSHVPGWRLKRKQKVYARFLDHLDSAVRLAAARGMANFSTRRDASALLDRLKVETEPVVRSVLMTAMQPHADHDYAMLLMNLALAELENANSNMATLQYRQLKDDLILSSCMEAWKRGTERLRLFALEEMGFLDVPAAATFMQQIAGDDAQPESLRGTAIEGLAHQKDPVVKAFLFQLFEREKESPLLGYQTCLAVSKMWQQDDMPQILKVLDLPMPQYEVHIQSALTAVHKKISAHKITLPGQAVGILYRFLDSDTINIQLLALRVLGELPEGVELLRLLTMLDKEVEPEIEEMLLRLVARNTPSQPQVLLSWLRDDQRTKREVRLAIQSCGLVVGPPAALVPVIQSLCLLAVGKEAGTPAAIATSMRALLKQPGVSAAAREALSAAPSEVTRGFFLVAAHLRPAEVDQLVSSGLLERAAALDPASLTDTIRGLAGLHSPGTKEFLMTQYMARPDLRELIGGVMRQALQEVN